MTHSNKPPIEWHRMDPRWWLDTFAKVTFWGVVAAIGAELIGDGQARWVYNSFALGLVFLGIFLVPELPREGEEITSFTDSLIGLVILFAMLCGIIALVIGIVIIPTALGGLFVAIGDSRHLQTALLLVVVFLLIGIYNRLGSRG